MAQKSNLKRVALGLTVLVILLVAFFASLFLSYSPRAEARKLPASDFFLGVTAGGTVAETKAIIDKVKMYTNLIAFTNLEVTKNLTSLQEVTNYAFANGLSFYVQTTFPTPFSGFNFNPITWAAEAKDKYGEKFLGYYLFDEPGGNQVDLGDYVQFDKSSMPYDFRDAANTYVYYLFVQLRSFIKTTQLVTSDYSLYWYDYEAGYDTVFCQLGWNNSRAINIALCRGAAEMHNKTWGAMLTWTYTTPPYMESAPDLYQDMITAYGAGAKYILIFNYPQTGPNGVLSEEHFDALKTFWEYAVETPQNQTSNTQKLAYVVPDNYGFGFRNPADKIWGVWNADEKAPLILNEVNSFVQAYGNDFDIIYGAPWTWAFGRTHYDKLVWWNSAANG
jgi:hypothetical protein